MSLLADIQQSGLILGPDASAAVANGWVISSNSAAIPCAEIESIYRVRLRHLQSLRSSHASQLAVTVAELLANIAPHLSKSCYWHTIHGQDEHTFQVVSLESNGHVVGCLRTVGKQAVSSYRWQELWQGEV
jgi:hypothetical protein